MRRIRNRRSVVSPEDSSDRKGRHHAAVFNLLPGERLATWGQWTTALHITAGCLLAALAVMHLYFVYAYAS